MERAYSQTEHIHPDYNFHTPKLITYPIPAGIASVLFVALYIFFYKISNR